MVGASGANYKKEKEKEKGKKENGKEGEKRGKGKGNEKRRKEGGTILLVPLIRRTHFPPFQVI